jgi:hypothetical protein
MGTDKPSWIDYVNLLLSVIVGIIGIVVAIVVSRSADHIASTSLMVETASFLLDDSDTRRQAGKWMYERLKKDEEQLPAWSEPFVVNFVNSSDFQVSPPSDPSIKVPDQTPPQQDIAQLFNTLSGSTLRLFIQIADEDQRPGAEALRRAVGKVEVGGSPIVAPGVQKVTSSPSIVQLRVLKSKDYPNAQPLAETLGRLLGLTVHISNFSSGFDRRSDIKGGTYELWLPHGQAVRVTLNE